jgi:hypothetical protein
MSNQLGRTGELWRQRHDLHRIACAIDFLENIGAVVASVAHTRDTRRRRHAKTVLRLRAAVRGVDEVAFEMGGQDTRTRGRQRARIRDALQNLAQRVEIARHCRRTKRCDAIFGEPRRNTGNGAVAVEGIDAFEPVDVDIDEPRNDVVIAQLDVILPRGRWPRSRRHIGDAITIED